MDTQQNNLPKDFFKQFKSKADFQSFFSDLYKIAAQRVVDKAASLTNIVF